MAKEKKKEPEDETPEEKTEAKEGEAEGAEGGEGEAAAEAGKGKSKKKIIIIAAAAVIVLAIAGGAAFFLLSHKKSGEEAKAGGEAAKIEQPVYYDLPQILVNLNTSGKQTSFIKASVTLELSAKEDVPIVEANLPRLMDSYNTFLREMRATDLYGSAGVYRLREEMLSRANTILSPVQVKDVLFREILVQ